MPIVTVLAKSYTRGQGFTATPNRTRSIAAVIVTASARLAANGCSQLRRKRVDDVEYDYTLRSSFGWTLAEQIVLNRYRMRAM